MNPFDFAQRVGYGPEEIMSFFAKSIPGFEGKVSQAAAAGFTTNQVIEFLQKQFGNKKVDSRTSRQLQPIFQDESMLGQRGATPQKEPEGRGLLAGAAGLAGGAVGGLVGGPMGAIQGAIGSATSVQDILTAYDQQAASGGGLGFGDFLKAAAKGVGSAALSKSLYGIIAQHGLGSDEEKPAPKEVDKAQPSVSKDIMEDLNKQGIDFLSLSTPRKNRINTLLEKLSGLEAQGKGPDNRSVQSTRKKILDFAQGKGLSVREEEQERFEQRGDEPLPERPHVKSQEELLGETQAPEKPTDETQEPPKEERSLGFESILFKPKSEEKSVTIDRQIKPMKNALKSSNVVGASHDGNSNKLRLIFAPRQGRKGGTVYEYDNVDSETFKEMLGGKISPKTEGESKMGVWFHGKDPSVGATFANNIRKNKEKFPFQNLEPNAWNLDEKQIIESNRTFLASDLFEPFAKKRKRVREVEKAKILKQRMGTLKAMDNEMIADMISYIEEKSNLKNPSTLKRLEKEIQKRLS